MVQIGRCGTIVQIFRPWNWEHIAAAEPQTGADTIAATLGLSAPPPRLSSEARFLREAAEHVNGEEKDEPPPGSKGDRHATRGVARALRSRVNAQ